MPSKQTAVAPKPEPQKQPVTVTGKEPEWQDQTANTERKTGPGLPPPACPKCGADNNWATINTSDPINVYGCRCGGRLEVRAD